MGMDSDSLALRIAPFTRHYPTEFVPINPERHRCPHPCRVSLAHRPPRAYSRGPRARLLIFPFFTST